MAYSTDNLGLESDSGYGESDENQNLDRIDNALDFTPEDLTSREGDFTGELAAHDNTGTALGGEVLAVWNGTNWLALDGSGTTF